MRKRDSKRRWIARFRAGKPVPYMAVVEYSLADQLIPFVRPWINMDVIVKA